MPVLNQPIDKLMTSDDLINMTSQPLAITSQPLTTTSQPVYVIRGDAMVTDAPQSWIEYVDEIMTSQSTETWVLLGCTFTSALIFIFSMLFIMLNCVCTRRRSGGGEKKKGENGGNVTSSTTSSRTLVTSSSSSSNQQAIEPLRVIEEMREEPQVVVAKQPPQEAVTSQKPQVSLESEIGNWLMKRNMRNNNLGEFPPKIPRPPPVVAR